MLVQKTIFSIKKYVFLIRELNKLYKNLFNRFLKCLFSSFLDANKTSKIQPLDVAVTSEFKAKVDKLSTEYMSKNMCAFLKGDVTTLNQRILFTKWVSQVWQDVCRSLKETVVRSFVKCARLYFYWSIFAIVMFMMLISLKKRYLFN